MEQILRVIIVKMKFRVTGMTCAACSARVEKVAKQVPGVTRADVNLLAGTLTVDADTDSVYAAITEKIGKQAIMRRPIQKKNRHHSSPLCRSRRESSIQRFFWQF